MNSRNLNFPAMLLLLTAIPVYADVMYQCVDENGHKSFSNIKSSDKSARCVTLDMGPAPAPASAPTAKAAPKAPTPASFPKVDDNTQKSRDTDRRRILDGELAAEQKNLEQAKKDLAEQEATILPNERMQHKTGGGINGSKVEERLQSYRDKIALHERNIEAIQKEIAKLR